MTKKDLFRIILKIYGVIALVSLIIQLPYLVLYLFNGWNYSVDWTTLVVPIINVLMVYFLLFKYDILIDGFKLNQGFDTNEVPTNDLNSKVITKIALIIIGVYLLVSNIGNLATNLIFLFGDSIQNNDVTRSFNADVPASVGYAPLITSAISSICGYLLLTNHTKIAQWLEKINTKDNNNVLDE